MGNVIDTGRTVRQLRNGTWTDVPVLIRSGHYCLCGDLHGSLRACVGSVKPSSSRPQRRRPVTPQGSDAQRYWPIEKRRLPRAIPAEVIRACGDCGPHHQAFYYCPAHRSEAVRKVLLASRQSDGIISLHLMMADRGYDIVS